MFKQLEGARLGLFVFLGTVLLVLAIFLIGDKSSLFVKSYYINTYFDDVQGLKTGASVRLSGISVGSVSEIKLLGDSTNRVAVKMRIGKELKKFIRLDSKASIETEGLIGSKIVSISPGSPNVAIVENNGLIQAKPTVSMKKIIEETQGIMAYTKNITKDFADIVNKINNGNGTIGKIVNDDKLYTNSVAIMKSADSTLNSLTKQLDNVSGIVIKMANETNSIFANVDSSAMEIRNLLARVKNGEGVLGALISDRSAYDSMATVISNLVKTTRDAREGTEYFVENMEALKHNWLFKSYFEERGYWDKSKYEKEINDKLEKLKQQEENLDSRIKELKELEQKISDMKRQGTTGNGQLKTDN